MKVSRLSVLAFVLANSAVLAVFPNYLLSRTEAAGTSVPVTPPVASASGGAITYSSATPFSFQTSPQMNVASQATVAKSNGGFNGMVYGNGEYVVGNERGFISTSPDGINWGTPTYALSVIGPSQAAVMSGATYADGLLGLVFNGGTFIANTLDDRIITATNPRAAWKQLTVPAVGRHFEGVAAFGTTGFIAFGLGQSIEISSNLGKTWAKSPALMESVVPGDAEVTAIASNGNILVAVGSNADGSEISRSTNGGTTWTNVTDGLGLYVRGGMLSAITFTGSEFVAAGPQGLLMTSPDGATWTKFPGLPAAFYPTTISYMSNGASEGTLVLLGADGSVLSSQVSNASTTATNSVKIVTAIKKK